LRSPKRVSTPRQKARPGFEDVFAWIAGKIIKTEQLSRDTQEPLQRQQPIADHAQQGQVPQNNP
jgi:hypothetical protein